MGTALTSFYRKLTGAQVSNGIKWLDDIQSFYRERAIIEREYSQKLRYHFYSLQKMLISSVLSKKYLEKKAKKSASLSVGDTPAITPGSLESASLTTWTTILDDTENLSRERGMLADSFNVQVADPLKNLGIKCEDLRRKVTFFIPRKRE
jgi:formin-binding protein 1